MKKRIENYQFEELNKEVLFINKYDLSFMYLYELNRYWKEFLFDLLAELNKKNIMMVKFDNLLTFLKNNYKIIIEENNLDIKIEDYVELNDYITLKEWLKVEDNNIEMNEKGIFLVKEGFGVMVAHWSSKPG